MSLRLDTIPVSDRPTDGRTELVKQYRALHASRDSRYRKCHCDSTHAHLFCMSHHVAPNDPALHQMTPELGLGLGLGMTHANGICVGGVTSDIFCLLVIKKE